MKEYLQILKQKIIKFWQNFKPKCLEFWKKAKEALSVKTIAALWAFWKASNKIWRVAYGRFYNFFNVWGEKLSKIGIKANWVSWTGFFIGFFAVNFLALEMYGWALFAILLNRFCDGIDGAIARATKVTNFGVFLDTTLDYIFYAGVLWGFSLGNTDNAVAACFLMFSFAAAACSMLAYSVVAYKLNSEQKLNLDNSPFYLGGIAQGSETLVVMVLLCLMPNWFAPMAVAFGILSLIKAFSVVVAAYYNFVIMVKK